MKFNKLTLEEERVIKNKHTEAPFTGKYDNFFEDGVYLCRHCDALLFDSNDKFNSHCGWPAFDDENIGSVKRVKDSDGRRIEILCSQCEGHLGHVFTGEKLTGKDTRYCVNSVSIRFVPRHFKDNEKHVAILGGGCFWCIEAAYRKVKGVEKVISGYAGGHKDNPTYEEVCKTDTGHAEVVKVEYNPVMISYDQVLSIFFSMHDPTTPNRQGNDIGEQYRSVIYYKTWHQKQDAAKFIENLEREKVFKDTVVTQVKPFINFYKAEEYHQQYYEKNPGKGNCRLIIAPKISMLKEKFKDLIQ